MLHACRDALDVTRRWDMRVGMLRVAHVLWCSRCVARLLDTRGGMLSVADV